MNDHDATLKLIQQLAQEEGKLLSPIDISLNIAKPLTLDRLQYVHFNSLPKSMKLSNTGETVILSAKWTDIRPYLTGGPLDGNYVFSQMHFHWGADEHEGSEHTVSGVSYPLEIHAAFYKSRYLTQAAALKHDDGLVMVVYLVKLQNKSTSGLHQLISHFPKVTQPETSTMLQPLPISSFIVPFSQDYLMYWGALASHKCSHSVMWLVCRSALAITTEDLSMFRTLLDSQNRAMTKNFRESNPPMERSLFHICPSEDTANLLLPGSVDSPAQEVIVGYTMVSGLDQALAVNALSKGDGSDDELDKISEKNTTIKAVKNSIDTQEISYAKRCNISRYKKGIPTLIKRPTIEANQDSTVTNSNVKSYKNYVFQSNKEVERVKLEKRDQAMSRKKLETQRKESNSKPSTPHSVGLSAATMKRLQNLHEKKENRDEKKENRDEKKENLHEKKEKRDETKDTKIHETAVCIHANMSDSEAPEPVTVTTPSQRPPARSMLSMSQNLRRKPSTPGAVTSSANNKPPTTPPIRTYTGKAVRTTGRGSHNRMLGCL